MISETDSLFMRMALCEARKGIGRTSPNPCVGSVVVKEGTVRGKGFHKMAGTPHAEIHALRRAGADAQGATLYVTLEPCSHTGRTPPCCEAIVASGIRRLVMGMVDPNPLVQGRGAEYLMSRGIAVTSGVLEQECRALNRPFIKHITTGRPWVVMKAGMSLDGKITFQGRKTGWMTGPESLTTVHRLRDVTDAIMVGIGTVAIDNPSLTTRLSSGKLGKDPIRIVVDSRLSISENARVINQQSSAQTWICCGTEVDAEKVTRLEQKGVVVRQLDRCADGGVDLGQILEFLGKKGVTSLLVEGGARVHGAMLRQQLYDYAHLFYAPVFVGDQGVSVLAGYEGISSEAAFRLSDVQYRRLGVDMMISGCLDYRLVS
ncbi:MAG: bifunctional diaminohydroxyphosphoribosylaminopyrimidine deaminase/5-amino-6-(5-phosphoribosylamino)uracil reductase RibD [Desulfoprunum sp.]|nr:bifunctional diaminohydroxyphosphoribosylaminopyrimidine deaminase/5-amino-6-(5-phosphoribosylamino)uracil reductase RibD [Desulfoprunum sp.]